MLEVLPRLFAGDRASLERLLWRYYLACCRAIWKLLPDETSREGIAVAERYLAGQANLEELGQAVWASEAAVFNFWHNIDPEAIQRWIEDLRAIPESELRSMVPASDELSPRDLLARACDFAYFATNFVGQLCKSPRKDAWPFLSAPLLRDVFRNNIGRTGARPSEQ